MTAILVPALKTLRSEFTQLSPGRDTTSDGWIADAAHVAGGISDHIGDEGAVALRGKDADNVDEVHAIDVDNDLKRAGWTMDRCVQIIVTRHKTGLDDRLQYVIWDRKIWSASWGWTARVYTGPSPHLEHGHFSGKYTSKQEADTRPWGLLEAARATLTLGAKQPANAPGSRLLRQGMTGPDVSYLQRWVGAKATGVFDAATKARVVRYQKIVGVADDGVAGSKTWSRILGRTIKL